MRKFTKIVAPALVAALGFSAVLPAVAEAAPRHEAQRHTPVRNDRIRAEINGLRQDIDRAAARRTISQREATSLRREAADLQRLYANYARGGLSRQETQTLQRKVDRIKIALRAERRDNNNHRR